MNRKPMRETPAIERSLVGSAVAAMMLAAVVVSTPLPAQAGNEKKPVLGRNRNEKNGPVLKSETGTAARRALQKKISDDLGKRAEITIRSSEEYDVSNTEKGVRGRGVAAVSGDDRPFRFDVTLNSRTGEARRVRYNFLDGDNDGPGNGSVTQRQRKAITDALEQRLRNENRGDARVTLRSFDDYDAGSNRDGVKGRAFADFRNGNDRTLTFDAVLNSRTNAVERLKWDFIDDNDPANNRLRSIAKKALEDEIHDDRDKDVSVNLRTADDYSISNSEKGLRGTGVATLDGNRRREFTYDVIINTRQGEARRVRYDWTNGNNDGGGDSREDMIETARRTIRRRLRDKHGDGTRVMFEDTNVKNNSGERVVSGKGKFVTPGTIVFQPFRYKVTLDRNGRVISAESNRD